MNCKHPVHAAGKTACTLQSKQKSNHRWEIKPVQEKKVHYFFWFKATTKTKPVPESFFRELYSRGCNKAEKSDLHVKEKKFPS